MYLEITYETALACHPKLVTVLMDRLARGKSKERGSAPETMKWGYSWGELVQGCSLDQLLRGERPVETRPLEERIRWGLTASKGRWKDSAQYMGPPAPVPPEVLASTEASLKPPPPLSDTELEAALQKLNPMMVVLRRPDR